MKNTWEHCKRYVVVICIVLFTVATLANFYRDMLNGSIQTAKRNLTESAEIFTTYFDNVIKEKFHHLEQAGKMLDKETLKDKELSQRIIGKYHSVFPALEVVDSNGRKLLGDDILINLSQEELERLVYKKEPMISDKVILDKGGNEVLVLCLPVENNEKVEEILLSTLYVADLNKTMNQWRDSSAGCAFLLDKGGRYITDGGSLQQILTGRTSNFYSYLDLCDIQENDIDSDDIAREIQKNRTASLTYKYSNSAYYSVLMPIYSGDWCVGYVANMLNYSHEGILIRHTTIVMGILAVIFWVVLVAYMLRLSYRYRINQENLQRYDMVQKQERSVIFEFQFSPKRLQFFGNTKEMFGMDIGVMEGEAVYEVYQYIHEDDNSVRGRIHKFYDDDASQFAAEVRIRNSEGEYGWFRISGMLLKDMRDGSNQKFIGKVENADQEIADEKNLVQRAENDLLTGVLNKKTMEEKVTKCLKNIQDNYHYIFFMVDLDNFKNVNDNLGHIMGDKAIVDTADRLSQVFPNNAYIGRLGGDEFAVCAAYDAFDEESLLEYVKKKAAKICEVNRRTYISGEKEISISSSVGIALAPDFAQDFETIYRMADKALYRSKNGGKNCYNIYEPEG